jgi:hypothetical protein
MDDTTQRTWAWRKTYKKVHPFTDKFDMMSAEELYALGADIKANGLREPITVDGDRTLLDGRNRLAAMELAGVEKTGGWWHEDVHDGDPIAFIISKNILRRHLTKQDQADLIVAAHRATPVSRQDGGKLAEGRPVNQVKAAAVASAKALPNPISERTVERAIAKAEGKVPAKPKRRSKAEIAEARAQGTDAVIEFGAKAEGKTSPAPAPMPKYTARPMPKPKSGKPVVGIDAVRQCYLDRCAEPDIDLDSEQKIVVDAWCAIAGKRAMQAQSPWTNPTPDIGQLVDDLLLGDIPEYLDRRRRS